MDDRLKCTPSLWIRKNDRPEHTSIDARLEIGGTAVADQYVAAEAVDEFLLDRRKVEHQVPDLVGIDHGAAALDQ